MKVVLVLSLPLLAMLAVLRALLFISMMIMLFFVCGIATLGLPDHVGGSFAPLTGVRRSVSRVLVMAVGRVILMCFGCWPGMLTVRGTWDPTCPVCAAAPHYGAADAFVFTWLGFPRPVILEPYSKIPVVKQILQSCGALLVPIASSTKGMKTTGDSASASGGGGGEKPKGLTTNATREAILRHKKEFDPSVDGAAPIVLFSEGITHSGCALLPLFKGAFEGGTAVQPIVVRYHHTHHNAAAFLNFSLGTHFSRLLTTPWMAISVDYLPTHQPTPQEAADGAIMAETVRAQMSRFSGLPMHRLGARELRKELSEAKPTPKPKEARAGEEAKALV